MKPSKYRSPFNGAQSKSPSESQREHEVEAARVVGGKRQPNSGRINGIGGKGDAKSDRFLVDAKQTDKASIRIPVEWIDKLCKDAWGLGKQPLFHLRWNNMPSQFPSDWVLLPAKEFERLRNGTSE